LAATADLVRSVESEKIAGRNRRAMRIKKAVITAAGKDQRNLQPFLYRILFYGVSSVLSWMQ